MIISRPLTYNLGSFAPQYERVAEVFKNRSYTSATGAATTLTRLQNVRMETGTELILNCSGKHGTHGKGTHWRVPPCTGRSGGHWTTVAPAQGKNPFGAESPKGKK